MFDIYGIVGSIRPSVHEYIAGFLLITCMHALFIFGRFIILNRHRGLDYVRPAVALFTLLAGTLVGAGGRWVLWHVRNNGAEQDPKIFLIVITVATILTSWGIVCSIKVFAPVKWPWWHNVVGLGAAAVIPYFIYLYH